MEILQLKYFLHAAHTENISHTAHAFMVPPSSVSAAVKKLESELGIKLFDRTANTLKLNECGRILRRALENAESEMKRARIDMLDLSAQPSGEIKLLILTNRRIVTRVISDFKLSYPAVSFNIRHSDYGDCANYADFDVIITDRGIEQDIFSVKSFIHDEMMLAVHETNPLYVQSTVGLKNLAGEKFICLPKGGSLRDYMDRLFRRAGFEPDIVIECDDPHNLREYLKMGLGVTFYPRISWGEPESKSVRLLKIDDGIYRDSYIYLNKNSCDAAKIFAETLELCKPA